MRTQRILIRLVFALAALCCGITAASAQQRPPSKPPWVQEKNIVDAAGRVHKRIAPITYAQRKAVAERQAKAQRLKAAQKNGEVKK